MSHTQINPTATMNSEGTVFTLTLPYPDPDNMQALNPHSSGNSHWDKSKATKLQRQESGLISSQCAPSTPWKKGRVFFHYFKPSGIVDAGLIPNDNHKHLNVGQMETSIDRKNPRVEIRIEKIGDSE
jgi:hypothetical protein